MKPCRKTLLAMAPSIGLVLGAPSHAQTYPQKTIKIIVTAAPGGPADFPARLAAQVLNTKFGQPVVVEHRPGAGGAIGAREVAKAPADGYTLLLGNTSTLAVIPAYRPRQATIRSRILHRLGGSPKDSRSLPFTAPRRGYR